MSRGETPSETPPPWMIREIEGEQLQELEQPRPQVEIGMPRASDETGRGFEDEEQHPGLGWPGRDNQPWADHGIAGAEPARRYHGRTA